MPGVTRDEGYRLGAPKEEEGLRCAADFLERLLGLPPSAVGRISTAAENILRGDLVTPGGATVEVKRQPIDPLRFGMNFVEVAELTDNPRRSDGFANLARLLSLAPADLAAARVHDLRDGGVRVAPLGVVDRLAVSIHPFGVAAAVLYVNPDAGWIYVYGRDEIREAVRSAVVARGFRRGQGRSNDCTLAVFVPVARWRFRRGDDGRWRYAGAGSAGSALPAARAVLSAASPPR